MRVRHPAVTLALSVCGAPQDEPDPPTPHPQAVPSPEPTAASSDILPGGPRINHLPGAMILVSSDTISLDQPLTIAGAGFQPGEPVRLVLLIDDTVSYVVGGRAAQQPAANAAGAFHASFDSIRGGGERGALERAPGTRTILAEGEDGSRASFPVVITSAPAYVTSVLSSLTATAETHYNKWEDSLDTWITAAGAGFIPHEAITITVVSLRDGADKILVGGTANDSGAFRIWITLHGTGPTEGADLEMPIAPSIYTLLAEGGTGTVATGPLVVERKVLPKRE